MTVHLILGLAYVAVGAWIWWGFREDVTQSSSPSRAWGLVHSVYRGTGFLMVLFGLGIAFAPAATLWVIDQAGNAALGGLKP